MTDKPQMPDEIWYGRDGNKLASGNFDSNGNHNGAVRYVRADLCAPTTGKRSTLDALNNLEKTIHALLSNPARPQVFGLPVVDVATIRSALRPSDTTLQEVKDWADGVISASGTEYSNRVGPEEYAVADAIIKAATQPLASQPCVDVDRNKTALFALEDAIHHITNGATAHIGQGRVSRLFDAYPIIKAALLRPSDAPADVWQTIKPLEWTERNSKGMEYCHTAVGFYEIGPDGFVYSPYVCKYPSYEEGLAAVTKDYTDKVSSLLTGNLIRTEPTDGGE